MEEKNYRAIFRQKKDEVHTPEEILQAFDSSFCACFTLREDRTPGAKMQMFGEIWDINPDAIIQKPISSLCNPILWQQRISTL